MDTYTVFVRDWYIYNDKGQRVPGPGEREILAEGVTLAEARAMCKEWNDEHDPGPLSRKAEFESE